MILAGTVKKTNTAVAVFSDLSYQRFLYGAGLINIYPSLIKEKKLPPLQYKFFKVNPAQYIYDYGSTNNCLVDKKAIKRSIKFLALASIYLDRGIMQTESYLSADEDEQKALLEPITTKMALAEKAFIKKETLTLLTSSQGESKT